MNNTQLTDISKALVYVIVETCCKKQRYESFIGYKIEWLLCFCFDSIRWDKICLSLHNDKLSSKIWCTLDVSVF